MQDSAAQHKPRPPSNEHSSKEVPLGVATIVRTWLDTNKIWFEAFAAVLLGVASILVAVLQLRASGRQNDIADKQTTLLSIQTEIARAEALRQEREDLQLRAQAWAEFRDLYHQVMRHVHTLPFASGGFVGDFSACERMPYADKCRWLQELHPLWSRLGSNRLVFEDPWLFGLYAKTLGDVEIMCNPDLSHRPEFGENTVPDGFQGTLKRLTLSLEGMSYLLVDTNLVAHSNWQSPSLKRRN
jgi:hypothetical protein